MSSAEPGATEQVRRLDELEAELVASPGWRGSTSERAARLAAIEQESLRLAGDDWSMSADLRHWITMLHRIGLPASADEAASTLDALECEDIEERLSGFDAAAAAGVHALLEHESHLSRHLREATPDRPLLAGQVPRLEEELARTRAACSQVLEGELADSLALRMLDESAETLTELDSDGPESAVRRLDLSRERVEWCTESCKPDSRRLRRSLRARRRRLHAEAQERELQGTLERRLGPRAAAGLERLVLGLIVVVLGILTFELVFTPGPELGHTLLLVDAAACAVFLGEFFLKLAWVRRGKLGWFARHFLVDFLPSIPFGLLLHLEVADPARAGRLARLLRLPRIARYLRLLAPAIRAVRALGFLARGMDRLVRGQRKVLNRDLVLAPDRTERARAHSRRSSLDGRLTRLRSSLDSRWEELLLLTPERERSEVAGQRTRAWASTRSEAPGQPQPTRREQQDERTLEELIEQLEAATPEDVNSVLGAEGVKRASRSLRWLARAPVRWLPFLRSALPRISRRMDGAETLAAGARRTGAIIRKHHDRLWFWADMHGTITPSELVDRTGSALVKSSIRPASRLLLFGALFLIVDFLLDVVGADALASLHRVLRNFVGPTLIVLGSVCLGILLIGSWLKRIARDATSFFERAASAQFLSLLASLRGRRLERDIRVLDARVLEPEARIVELDTGAGAGSHEDPSRRARFEQRARDWLLSAQAAETRSDLPAVFERTVMLYRDHLDGALLGENDTRASAQLLGNPSLLKLRELSSRVDRREQKELRALDLEGRSGGVRGPYLWFSLVTRSIARSAARLIVEYNRNALTIEQRERATPEACRRFEAWLEGHPAGGGPEQPASRETSVASASSYQGSTFTALHFLDDDPARDEEVLRVFGAEVLEMLREDRRRLFCRIFGTYPLHQRTRSERVVNLGRLYDDWLSHGRVFLMPLRLGLLGARGLSFGAAEIASAARVVSAPRLRQRTNPIPAAEFSSASRKIDRMRGPVVRAALWMRARFDPQYLGLTLPGLEELPQLERTARLDLDFLGASGELRRRVADEKQRQRADLVRLERLLDDGLAAELAGRLELPALRPGHLRAIAIAYCADFDGLRTDLSAEQIVREVFLLSRQEKPPRDWRYVPPRVRRALHKAWRALGSGDPLDRDAARDAVERDLWDVRAALLTWDADSEEARERAIEHLLENIRHPERTAGLLADLRTVQTLALLDVQHYREHVFRLGRFDEAGDELGPEVR